MNESQAAYNELVKTINKAHLNYYTAATDDTKEVTTMNNYSILTSNPIGAINMKDMYKDVLAKINQRQRQIIAHSVLYYKYDTNIIPDAVWGRWARELVKLQSDYKDLTTKSVFYEVMKDFDASTGYHLQDNEWGIHKALQLMMYN